MPTWCVVRKYENLPEAIEVVKETPKSIVYLSRGLFGKGPGTERRALKVTEWERYFPTQAEAIDYLITRTTTRLNTASMQCNELKQALMALEDMRRKEEGGV